MLSEHRKKSANHSVSESSTSLHKLCVTSQPLNRMTFKNVTNITLLVPVIVNVWAAAKEPNSFCYLQYIFPYVLDPLLFHSSACQNNSE